MFGIFRKKNVNRDSREPWRLDAPVFRFASNDDLTLGRLMTGVFIAGQTGSAKSTSSATHLAEALLRAGFGILVLSVKSERTNWLRLCRDTGRLDDLLIFDSSCKLRFNPIDFEIQRGGAGAGHCENVVHLLMTLIECAGRRNGRGDGREDSSYWQNACKELLRNAVDLAMVANGRVTIAEIQQIILSAPTSPEQVRSEHWRTNSYCFKCLQAADKAEKTARQANDFALAADFFLISFCALSDKTRSVVISTFTSIVDCLLRGLLRDLFGGDSNVSPLSIEDGRVLLVDLPVKEFGQVGLIANMLWKMSFQKSIERRDVNQSSRPVALICDEGHHFLHNEDSLFASTCRSSRVAQVLITQNIPNLDVALGGGETGRAQAESLLANFGTLIFHCNTCSRTNEFASGLIGKRLHTFANGSISNPTDDWPMATLGFQSGGQATGGFSESFEYELQPSVFPLLRTGGQHNRWEADAIVIKSGDVFRSTGQIYMPVTFKQKF